jgi:hypothetical protein
MGTLTFACPTTGREFESGIETDLETLHSVRSFRVRLRCACCGEAHLLPIRAGRLGAGLPEAMLH